MERIDVLQFVYTKLRMRAGFNLKVEPNRWRAIANPDASHLTAELKNGKKFHQGPFGVLPFDPTPGGLNLTEKINVFILGGDRVEMVDSFIFLGSKIEVSGECGGEINSRLVLAITAMSGWTKIWKDKPRGGWGMLWYCQLQCMDVSHGE